MPRLIALDLGGHAIKASTYRINGRDAQLEDRYHQVVPQDGALPDLPARLVALDAMLDDLPELRPAGNDVLVLAYPSSLASFHRMSLPFRDDAQIEQTLPFAVENEVPFDLEDMVLGWRVAERGEQTQVMAVLVKHDTLSEWLTSLAQRRIDPAAVHVDTDLYGPWADRGEPGMEEDSGLIVVVDVGHEHTAVSVVRDGVVQLSRSISVAGWAFTRAIQDGLQSSWAEAEEAKHGPRGGGVPVGLDADDEHTDTDAHPRSGVASLPAPARERLDASIRLLIAELRSTLIHAEDVLGSEVREVRLTGGSARIDSLWDALRADLGVPIQRAVDPGGDTAPGAFALSTALARATLPGGTAEPVDLRVDDLQYRGGMNLLRAGLTYGFAGAAFFTVAATLMFAFQFISLSREQRAAEDAVREVVTRALPDVPQSAISTLTLAKATMAGFTEDAAQRAAVLGEGDGIPPTISTLSELTGAFPPHPDVTVQLSELTITPNSISFHAQTDGGFASSAAVEEALKSHARFARAIKGQEQKAGNTLKFPITIPLGEDASVEEEG